MRRLRLILACLLLIAVPLQGMAGAAMLFCETHEHAAAHDHAGASHEQHDHAAGIDAKCSACAACCHGAVASQALQVPRFSVPSQPIAALPDTVMRVRATPPPDKPPRA